MRETHNLLLNDISTLVWNKNVIFSEQNLRQLNSDSMPVLICSSRGDSRSADRAPQYIKLYVKQDSCHLYACILTLSLVNVEKLW